MCWHSFTGMHTYRMHGYDRVLYIIKSMFMDMTGHPSYLRTSAGLVKVCARDRK
jgi:hypothetical protein